MTKIVSQMPDGLYEWKDGVPTLVPGAPMAIEPPAEIFPTVVQPLPGNATVVRPLMSEQIGIVPSDFSTADATKMPGPGKPAEATGTGDAEKGDENNYMSPEMRQEFVRLTDPEKGPEGG